MIRIILRGAHLAPSPQKQFFVVFDDSGGGIIQRYSGIREIHKNGAVHGAGPSEKPPV